MKLVAWQCREQGFDAGESSAMGKLKGLVEECKSASAVEAMLNVGL